MMSDETPNPFTGHGPMPPHPADRAIIRDRLAMYEGTARAVATSNEGLELARRVTALADRARQLEGLAGELLATIQVNADRGHTLSELVRHDSFAEFKRRYAALSSTTRSADA